MIYNKLGFVIIDSVNTVKERFPCNLPKSTTSVRIFQSIKNIHTTYTLPTYFIFFHTPKNRFLPVLNSDTTGFIPSASR